MNKETRRRTDVVDIFSNRASTFLELVLTADGHLT